MRRPLALFTTCLALVGCSEASLGDAIGATSTAPTDPGSWTGGGSSTPPETEDDAFFALPPAQTDVYVFIANPSRNTVTRVNVQTLQVRTTPVGVDPQITATTSDWTTAVVFNRGDDSVSILDADTLDQIVVGVRDNFNQMKLSPDGRFAVLWHDQAAERPDDPPAEGLQSFNEASFVDLATGEHWPMAVGYNPRDVVFTPDGAVAAIVSDDYLAIVDLMSAALAPRLIRLTDAVEPPEAEEVVLAPDGSYAFVRQFGATEVLVVDLLAEEVAPVPVGLNPTDLDLSPDGAQAIVVARGSEQLFLLDTADPFAPPTAIALPPGEGFGSLALDPSGQRGIVYTTATPSRHYGLWDRATGVVDLAQPALVKPIQRLAFTPTGESVLVFHTLANGDADPGSPFYDHWAMTVLSMTGLGPNPLLLPAEPTEFANSTDGRRGYFLMDGERYLETLDYTTSLADEVPLASVPVFVGVLPDLTPQDASSTLAWASQEHDLGRISFYDPTTASLETVTGFELNSEIED